MRVFESSVILLNVTLMTLKLTVRPFFSYFNPIILSPGFVIAVNLEHQFHESLTVFAVFKPFVLTLYSPWTLYKIQDTLYFCH